MPNAKKRSRAWILLALLPVCATAVFFSMRALSRTPPKLDAEKLVKVERIDLARSVVATGKIEPTTKVEIKSKASGIILKLAVNVGDRVHQGQVICELDQNDLLPQVRQAQAALDMAEAALKSAQAEYERAKVDAAGPTFRFSSATWSAPARCSCEGGCRKPRATTAEKNYELATEPPAAGDSQPGRRPARPYARPKPRWNRRAPQLATTEEDLRNATIVSPIDGVVLSRDREVGDAVSSILTMGSGATLIMTVGDLREVYVKGKVDESDIGKVYPGTGRAHHGANPTRTRNSTARSPRFRPWASRRTTSPPSKCGSPSPTKRAS